jgi:biotin operon repressor BirA-like protein
MTKDIVQARTWQLLNILADGEFHSGEVLAGRLGVSRASVFNALSDVAEYGVVLQRIRGRGYRLAQPWQRLEREEVLHWLGKDAGQFSIGILPQAASSNTLLAGCREWGGTRRQRTGGGITDRRARADGADMALRTGQHADVFPAVAI